MKTKALILSFVLLAAALSFAQQSGQTTPPAAGAQAGPARHQQMQEHMQAMKAQLEKMKSSVEQMKANLAKIKDPGARQQAQLDLEMWQGVVDHLSAMMEHMGPGMMGGPGMGMMGHGDMQGGMAGCTCCAGMKHDDDHHAAGCCCSGMAQGDAKGGCCGCCGGAGGMKCGAPPAEKK